MTREEAIEVFEYEAQETISFCSDSKHVDDRSKKFLDAVEVAIEELKAEPCEDTISRQAYIERYRKWGYSEFGRKVDNEALAIRVAMSLSSATPKQKTGKWIKVAENTYRCNLCGRTVHKDTTEDMQIDYPYCHCGAKMSS